MTDKRSEVLLLALVLVLAAALRSWGIGFGLPYVLHQDEPIIVNHALAYGSGDLNPHFFIIPPFASYLVFACYAVYYLLGNISGMFPGPENFAVSFFSDPTAFYYIARVVLGFIPSVLSVWLVWMLHKRLFGGRGPLFAAVLTAVSFLAVVNAHYAYVDNMMVFFVLAVYLAMTGMMARPSLMRYVVCGALLGLAVSVKYNSAILAVPFFIAHVAAKYDVPKKRSIFLDKYLWMAVLAGLAAFVITNPFAVLDWRAFLFGGLGKIRHEYIGWTHHLSYSVSEGIGGSFLVTALAGSLIVFFREKKIKALFFLSFPVVFYIHLVLGSQQFSRYALPLIPFIAISTSYLIFAFLAPAAKNRFVRAVVYGIAVMLAVPTAVKSITADMLFTAGDTRAVSAEWIEKNIPQGTTIAVDHTAFRPCIFQAREQILEKQGLINAEKGLDRLKDKKIDYMLKAAESKKAYNVYFMKGGARSVQFLSEAPSIDPDMKALRDNGIEYVVVNYNDRSPVKESFLKALAEKASIIKTFSPYRDNAVRAPYDGTDMTFMAIGTKELLSRRLTGPCLVIYKMRNT